MGETGRYVWFHEIISDFTYLFDKVFFHIRLLGISFFNRQQLCSKRYGD